MSRLLTIGRVQRPHGVRGLLRVRLDLEDCAWLQPGQQLLVGDTLRELCRFGPAPGGAPNYLVAFVGLEGRDAVEPLKGLEIQIARDALPELDEDEGFYIEDLVGLQAQALPAQPLGPVREVFELAGRMMARVEAGLIPLDGPVIEAIDFDEGTVTFDLPEGLFEAQR